jgi:hypothetical protein
MGYLGQDLAPQDSDRSLCSECRDQPALIQARESEGDNPLATSYDTYFLYPTIELQFSCILRCNFLYPEMERLATSFDSIVLKNWSV